MRHSKQRGAALLIVLMVVALVAIIASEMGADCNFRYSGPVISKAATRLTGMPKVPKNMPAYRW